MALQEMDKIIYPVCKLCRDHERVRLMGSNLTVLSMGEARRLPISRNLPGDCSGFPLRIGSHRCPKISGTLDLPMLFFLGIGAGFHANVIGQRFRLTTAVESAILWVSKYSI